MRNLLFALVVPLLTINCGGTDPPVGMPDMTSTLDGSSGDGGQPFGAACTMNADCVSALCFMGGMRSFCSLHCTTATAAHDCPVPPTSGGCNMQGFCKP